MYYVEGAGASQMMLSDMGMMQSQMMMTSVIAPEQPMQEQPPADDPNVLM